MPEFVIDTCITIKAMDQEAAAFHARILADLLRFKTNGLVQGVHICDVQEAPPPRSACEGHPAGPSDPMGQTAYCDGTCKEAT